MFLVLHLDMSSGLTSCHPTYCPMTRFSYVKKTVSNGPYLNNVANFQNVFICA